MNHSEATLRIATLGPVIPVIVIDRLEDALPLAHALVEGGVRVLEITLRTPVALTCIEAISRHVPDAVVGAGTVRSPDDARRAREAGAQFAVSPGYTSEVARGCTAVALPLLPGVATPSELMAANADGFRFLKFFPAAAAGGIAMLKALASPFADVSFCPTGGITEQTARDYLALSNVRCVGGSWLTPADAMRAGDWGRVRALASAAAAISAKG